MGLRDTLREAAAEIFGYRDEREELLEEGRRTAKLIQRALENVGWSDIAGGTMRELLRATREAREQYIEPRLPLLLRRPIIKRSVKIRTKLHLPPGCADAALPRGPRNGRRRRPGPRRGPDQALLERPGEPSRVTSKKAYAASATRREDRPGQPVLPDVPPGGRAAGDRNRAPQGKAATELEPAGR